MLRYERRYRGAPADALADPPPITAAHVDAVIAAWTGIPAGRLSRDGAEGLADLRARLSRRVIDQEEAVSEVAAVVQASRAGLSRPRRPIGVFLFLGPTGVGKTELARALADELFHDEERLARIDMSEHHDEHAVTYLNRGSARGGQGDLTRAIADCTRAIELEPRLWQVWCARGIALAAIGRREEAAESFRGALERCPPSQRAVVEALRSGTSYGSCYASGS